MVKRMATYRLCRVFTVESGHMLSKHPERCRHPHGHTRQIEVVVRATSLDENDMLIDFKALKMAVQEQIDIFDHSMAINSSDPLVPMLSKLYPDGVVIYEDQDPTTEVMARDIFEMVADLLKKGWEGTAKSGAVYKIQAGRVTLERVRLWETPNSWAEFGE